MPTVTTLLRRPTISTITLTTVGTLVRVAVPEHAVTFALRVREGVCRWNTDSANDTRETTSGLTGDYSKLSAGGTFVHFESKNGNLPFDPSFGNAAVRDAPPFDALGDLAEGGTWGEYLTPFLHFELDPDSTGNCVVEIAWG